MEKKIFSGKHASVVLKFEVWSTLQGIPIFVSGAMTGSQHDASVLRRMDGFKHYEGEHFLADLGYIGWVGAVQEIINERASTPTLSSRNPWISVEPSVATVGFKEPNSTWQQAVN